MTHKNHLETRIRDTYSFIREHHKIIDVSSRPEEKYDSRQKIQHHWAQIERYLRDYLLICQRQRAEIPEDIGEMIAAKFPNLPAIINRGSLPQEYRQLSADALGDTSFLSSMRELRMHHQVLEEWKELHNLLQEVVTSLTPLIGALELVFDGRGTWDEALGSRLWRQARIQLRRLESFSRDVNYIDEPYEDSGGKLRGAAWMVEIEAVQGELESSIREGNPPASYNLAIELSDICFTHLYRADKCLRDAVGEICTLSDIILRSIDNGR